MSPPTKLNPSARLPMFPAALLLPLLPPALLLSRTSTPRARASRCTITAAEPSFDAFSLPALLPDIFVNGGDPVVKIQREDVYSEVFGGWVTQIVGIEVTPAGFELGFVIVTLLLFSRIQRERRGWLPREEASDEAAAPSPTTIYNEEATTGPSRTAEQTAEPDEP